MNKADQRAVMDAYRAASDAINALNFHTQVYAIDFRNLRHDMQATGKLDIDQLNADGKTLKLKCEAALKAYGAFVREVQQRQGREAA